MPNKTRPPTHNTEQEADLIIFNTCAVKGPTENRIINDIKHAPKNKKIIIVGCLPKISFERLNTKPTLTPSQVHQSANNIIELVETGSKRRKSCRPKSNRRKTQTIPTKSKHKPRRKRTSNQFRLPWLMCLLLRRLRPRKTPKLHHPRNN